MNIFKRVTEQTGIDEETVKDTIHALLKVLVYELRQKGKARIPDLGDFRIVEYKSRTIGNVNTGNRQTLPVTKVLKFRPCKNLRDYIKMMD